MDISTVMENNLRRFADQLVPSDDYITKGTAMVEKVLRVLEKCYVIDRHIYAGSIGKSTEIMDADFDVVAFLRQTPKMPNGGMPPFTKILADWENILGLDESLKIDPDSIKTSRFSVQFKFSSSELGTYDVDLLPATNFVIGDKPAGEELADLQRQKVMEVIDEKNFQMFSSSVSETHVYLMKQQSTLAHQAVRLAKFWLTTLYFGNERRPYGIKTLLELIVVAAAMKEDAREEKMLLRIFAKFLDDVKRVDKLQLAFEQKKDRWTVINYHGSGIIDPGNPYNNLLKNLLEHPKYLENLKKFAGETRDKIPLIATAGKVARLFEIFAPQKIASFPFPRVEVLSDGDPYYRSYMPSMKIRNERLYKQIPNFKDDIEYIKKFLVSVANSAAAENDTGKEKGLGDFYKNVNQMVDSKLIGRGRTSWSGSGAKHEDFDVTFLVPILTCDEAGALMYSFKWV